MSVIYLDKKVINHMNAIEKLNQLQKDYIDSLPKKLNELTLSWEQTRQSPNTDNLLHLKLLAHRLAGSGTSYGFPRISEAALALDSATKQLITSPHTETLFTTVEESHTRLKRALESCIAGTRAGHKHDY